MKTKILTPKEVEKLTEAELTSEIKKLRDVVKVMSLDELTEVVEIHSDAALRIIDKADTSNEDRYDSAMNLAKRLNRYGDVISKEHRARLRALTNRGA